MILCYRLQMCNCSVSCFFFQAEDGIRDLVRSRGLGDVYKRQPRVQLLAELQLEEAPRRRDHREVPERARGHGIQAVSYTHLTLPTSDLV